MKIGLLVPEMPPDAVGGGGVVFDALARRLVADGHAVTVVAAATYRGPRDEHPPDGFELIRVPELAHPTPEYRTSMPPLPGRALVRAIRALRACDVVNAHGYACPLVDVIGAFLDPREIVFTLHGFLYTIPERGGALAAAYNLYDRCLGARVFRSAHRVTAVSSAVALAASERGRPDCAVIPNGFAPPDPRPLAPEIAREAARGPYLLCIGRLQWLKGFDTAMEALALLRERGSRLRLLIAGRDGGYETALRQKAERLDLADAVSFLGFVPNDQIATLLAASEAYLLTSRIEALSVSAMEALSAGAPSILSKVGGMPDIATDGVNAIFATPEVPATFADAVERLQRDPELRDRIVANGRVRVREFAWPRIARLYEATYDEVLASMRA